MEALAEAGSLAGFVVEADLPLVGLSPPWPAATRRLQVRIATRPELVRLAGEVSAARHLGLSHVGEFLVTGPSEVLVAPAEGASSAQVSAFLCGPCFSLVAYLNGLVPLHAALAERGDAAVAVAGPSGCGKSTLAGALVAAGVRLASDDVCFMEAMADGCLRAWPGVRRLRLRHDSAVALRHADGTDVLPPESKHNLGLPAAADRPHSLAGVYVLAEAPRTSIERLRGAVAAERLIANAHRPDLARVLGVWPDVVRLCARLAGETSVHLFRRPLEFAALDASAGRLLRHAWGQAFAETGSA